MDKNDFKNVAVAIVLSLAVLFGVEWFFPTDPVPSAVPYSSTVPADVQPVTPTADNKILPVLQEADDSPVISIQSDTLTGSIRLKGARFDHLTLRSFKETLAKDSPDVTLLTPSYYAAFGMTGLTKGIDMPDDQTLWTADREELTPETPVTLTWTNAQGIEFKRIIRLDKEYMFTVSDEVVNTSAHPVAFAADGVIVRINPPETQVSTVHEGFVGVLDGSLREIKLKDLKDDQKESFTTTGGWMGLTEKYWLSALAFDQKLQNVSNVYSYQSVQGKDVYSAYFVTPALTVPSGQRISNTSHFFAGPKELKLLADYQKDLGIEKFELAIDFGWFYFLTKPFLIILGFLNHFVGNMGVAILIFATLLRLLLLPIAGKSYESMAKMRKLQPKLKDLQERYKNDKMRLNQEMMMLYKKEKVNPASGCLPLFIQIPIFFSLYKVLSVSIEMRQAPFFGWIQDLSAPDPSSVFTLFGLIPWDVPTFLNIGVWPVLMGITMYLQQKMSPQVADKNQAMVLRWMPVLFMFMLGRFASGLVIYWTWSNVLSIIQQRYVMHKYGVD